VAPGVRLEAINLVELTKLVFEYRIRNNISIGDIERDINDHYCRTYPDACYKETHEYGQARTDFPHIESLGNRVARWAMGLLRGMPQGGLELVNNAEAQSGALVCLNCVKNLPWMGGCGGCHKSVTTVLAQLKNTNRTPQDSQLYACSVAGWGNETSIWLGPNNLPVTSEQLAAMPAQCWRKNYAL
jgi:hypothetical protein